MFSDAHHLGIPRTPLSTYPHASVRLWPVHPSPLLDKAIQVWLMAWVVDIPLTATPLLHIKPE